MPSSKKRIQSAIKRKGALTRKAKARGMTIAQYCTAVKTGKIRATTRTKRQCNLRATLRKFVKKKRKR